MLLAFFVLGGIANWAAEEPGGAITAPIPAFRPVSSIAGKQQRQWLPIPITVVGTDQETAVTLSEGLRVAGFSLAPISVGQFNDRIDATVDPRPGSDDSAPAVGGAGQVESSSGVHPSRSVVWITNAAANLIDPLRLAEYQKQGKVKLLLDGVSSLSTQMLGLRDTRTETRKAQVFDAESRWDELIPLFIPGVEGKAIAKTADGDPAVFRSGDILWTLPRLDTGQGLERITYLPQILQTEFGVDPVVERRDIELYVDPDLESKEVSHSDLAKKWRRLGISRVYLAAWKDDRLTKTHYDYAGFVHAMHAEGIKVLAWVEWPHVNFSFWKMYPECREVTATGVPARIFWREHVALNIPHCYELAWADTKAQLELADYDGVNLAELYYEPAALGPERPEEYTPFHPETRKDFAAHFGFDPQELMDPTSDRYWKIDNSSFLVWNAYRKKLITDLHEKTLFRLRELPAGKDLMVTAIDDRWEVPGKHSPPVGLRMSDNIGADTKDIIALNKKIPFTFQSEDPFTAWAHDPTRYANFDKLYSDVPIDNLVIDINVVHRFEAWAVTNRITEAARGIELYKSVASVGSTGARLAMYASKTVKPLDLEWIRFALGAGSTEVSERNGAIHTSALRPFWLRLVRPVRVITIDGVQYPGRSQRVIEVPAGDHTIILE